MTKPEWWYCSSTPLSSGSYTGAPHKWWSSSIGRKARSRYHVVGRARSRRSRARPRSASFIGGARPRSAGSITGTKARPRWLSVFARGRAWPDSVHLKPKLQHKSAHAAHAVQSMIRTAASLNTLRHVSWACVCQARRYLHSTMLHHRTCAQRSTRETLVFECFPNEGSPRF